MSLVNSGDVQSGKFYSQEEFVMNRNLVLMPVITGGEKFTFIFDTGAEASVISPEIADQFQLKTKVKYSVNDANGISHERSFYLLDTVEVGDIQFFKIAAVKQDMSIFSDVMCTKIDGILGANMMHKAIWRFDFQKQEVLITNDLQKLPSSKDEVITSFSVNKFKLTPLVNLSFDGKIHKRLLTFDMGSGGGVSLGKHFLKTVKETPEFNNAPSSVGNASVGLHGRGKADTTFYSYKNVSLENVDLGEQMLKYKVSGSSIIGMGIIKNYDLQLNWFDRTITMNQIIAPETDKINSTGFYYSFIDKACVVSELFSQSNASISGLKLNDTLLSINGRKFSGLSEQEECAIKNNSFLDETDSFNIEVKRDDRVFEVAFKRDEVI